MNAVERVLWYADATNLAQEPPHEITDADPGPQWPERGQITFDKVAMSYRPGLPPVLKGMWVNQI